MTFYHKFVEIYKLFSSKTAYYVKILKKISKIFWKICFLWSRYGAGTGTGTVTFSKVGTGTINFQKLEPEP